MPFVKAVFKGLPPERHNFTIRFWNFATATRSLRHTYLCKHRAKTCTLRTTLGGRSSIVTILEGEAISYRVVGQRVEGSNEDDTRGQKNSISTSMD